MATKQPVLWGDFSERFNSLRGGETIDTVVVLALPESIERKLDKMSEPNDRKRREIIADYLKPQQKRLISYLNKNRIEYSLTEDINEVNVVVNLEQINTLKNCPYLAYIRSD